MNGLTEGKNNSVSLISDRSGACCRQASEVMETHDHLRVLVASDAAIVTYTLFYIMFLRLKSICKLSTNYGQNYHKPVKNLYTTQRKGFEHQRKLNCMLS